MIFLFVWSKMNDISHFLRFYERKKREKEEREARQKVMIFRMKSNISERV